jgi:hypothetical protein
VVEEFPALSIHLICSFDLSMKILERLAKFIITHGRTFSFAG